MILTQFFVIVSILLYGVCAVNLPYNYHEVIGIKKAEEIRKSEALVWNRGSRIIGGTQVPEGSHISYQAGIIIILTTGWTSVCGGSLVSNTKVLTAAHCWYDGRNQARQITVVLGSTTLFTGGTRFVTTNVVTHSSWNTQLFTNDIAMATIPAVEFTNTIQRITLPTLAQINQDFAGISGLVSGYGKTSDAQSTFPITTSLYQTSVNIITNAACQQSYGFDIAVSQICTSGEGTSGAFVGTCDGDSGGPLTVVYNNARLLVGIVSFGFGESCETNLPSVYTRVTGFINWIEANL